MVSISCILIVGSVHLEASTAEFISTVATFSIICLLRYADAFLAKQTGRVAIQFERIGLAMA